MEDLSKIEIPPLPILDFPKTISIEFDNGIFPTFEGLLKTVMLPLGYNAGKKTVDGDKAIIPFTKKRKAL